MKLKVVAPEKPFFEGEVDSVTLPGSEGQMTILKGHAALAATLQSGPFYYRQGEKRSAPAALGGGFVEVLDNQVTVITLSCVEGPGR